MEKKKHTVNYALQVLFYKYAYIITQIMHKKFLISKFPYAIAS